MQAVFGDYAIMMDPVKVEKKDRKLKREPNKLVIINEEELIRQVQIRPILYDKSLKSYRKSALRNQSWNEIGQFLGSSVDECRKRWRSLRDAFSKHYKTVEKCDDSKRKKWIFYDQMLFIAPYLENSKLELNECHMVDFQDNSHESIIVHEQDDDHHTEEEVVEQVYNGKLQSDDDEDDHHHHTAIHGSASMHINDENAFISDIFESPDRQDYHPTDLVEALDKKGDELSAEGASSLSTQESHSLLLGGEEFTAVPTQLSSDEKFLLSCSPILKRLTDKQNALARLKIQEILYNIEFGDS